MRKTYLGGLLLIWACSQTPTSKHGEERAQTPATEAEARAYLEKLNTELKELWTHWARTDWVKSTYITHDTDALSAAAQEKVMAYTSEAIVDATRFDRIELDDETRRQFRLLKISQSLPAPSDPVKRKRLAELAAKMTSIYGQGKYCPTPDKCQNLLDLSETLATQRNYAKLLEAWQGWHKISVEMRPLFEEFVALGNEGAREIGFTDLGELWRYGYDMPADAFEAETDRLWNEVKPLYEQLHCYVRARLSKRYGAKQVPEQGPIPAHLLGNMWAQEWMKIYDMVEPYPGQSDIDVTRALKRKKYTELDMVRLGEKFFTSLGLDALPTTFWERSMFVKPKDREVECHASAWDVTFSNDLRIKMCIKVDEEDLITIHHELGHNYYYMYYHPLPALYQNGANDGFHEGIGDTLALSVTPGYLKEAGILSSVATSEKALINQQMKMALDKIAFLPFGKLIDQWRWDVFTGKVTPANYNQAWWDLRAKYQGVMSPVARSEADFDPGAKYHIPANVPYTRYFLARILQFQFHEALCKTAGQDGPLHGCSIYGNRAAGDKLKAMLSLGASKPWPDALEVVTGTRQMDATPLKNYFAPLMAWLEKANQGKTCGW